MTAPFDLHGKRETLLRNAVDRYNETGTFDFADVLSRLRDYDGRAATENTRIRGYLRRIMELTDLLNAIQDRLRETTHDTDAMNTLMQEAWARVGVVTLPASITTPEGQRDYYCDLITELGSENERLARDNAELDAYHFSLFRHVMEASEHFVVTRFKGYLTQAGTWAKYDEESREFKDALRLLAMASVDRRPMEMRGKTPDELRKDAAGELIDVLVTLGGMAAQAGITWTDIEAAARETLVKLDNRTTETYEWREDVEQVVRKGRRS